MKSGLKRGGGQEEKSIVIVVVTGRKSRLRGLCEGLRNAKVSEMGYGTARYEVVFAVS